MSVQMEQHKRWALAHSRLWSGAGSIMERRPKALVRSVPVKRAKPALPPATIDQYGWPIYLIPVFYDHCEGMTQVKPLVTWRTIARDVAAKHGLPLSDLMSIRRNRTAVAARHEAFWRCRMETTLSLPQIGHRFGGRDHSTVLHGLRKHAQRMAEAQ